MIQADPALVTLLEATVAAGASDLHLSVGRPATARRDGMLVTFEGVEDLDPETIERIIMSLLDDRKRAELHENHQVDFSFGLRGIGRFRANAFRQRGALSLALRVVPFRVRSLEELGAPWAATELLNKPYGLVLVVGPTGSGKSTTLAALVDFINKTHDHHIITIEDPIEFYHYSQKSTVNQREIGTDVMSFSEALRRALRQDPDVILVGELRDLETIEAAISAAETGHVVFGTLHTSSAQGTINRIIDAFPTNQQEQVRTQLSTAIIGVVSQALLPKIGGGRCAAYEVLVVDDGIGNLIRENKTFRINSSIQTGAKKGMRLLDDDLFRLWNEKKVTEEAVLAKAQKVDDLAKRILNAKQGIFDDEETIARKAKDHDK